MKRIATVVAFALLVLGIGYKIYQDPEIQKRIAPSIARAPQNTQLVPPTFARDYADAFCRADAPAIAAATEIEGVTEDEIAAYFSGDPTCLAVRYLGQLTDGGMRRYIFVFDFPDGRTDWCVFSFSDGEKLVQLKRG
ncbi:MAG TPA: hypothetical protein VGR43_00240 [Dehalococcoidia bacterium]|jgi:hypothetical protein|nr:hypothetical protein [Dehalococcoidia bacterium]